ncbi:MAG: hypothetical protein V9E83_07500 [Baekduia sp.]
MRDRPSSHLITGIVLRALAAHPDHRGTGAAIAAARLLGSRLWQADRYADRRAAGFWQKFRYPFRFTDLVSALDAMQLAGLGSGDEALTRGLDWLAGRQGDDGLWRTPYDKAADREIHAWVSFAIARLFHRAGLSSARSRRAGTSSRGGRPASSGPA